MPLWFIYTADHDYAAFYETETEFLKAMADYDFLKLFHSDGWHEEVENCFAGCITGNFRLDGDNLSDDLERYVTHRAQQVNRIEQPDDLDENGFSPSQQRYWDPDWSYICMYVFQPIVPAGAPGITAIDEDHVAIPLQSTASLRSRT